MTGASRDPPCGSVEHRRDLLGADPLFRNGSLLPGSMAPAIWLVTVLKTALVESVSSSTAEMIARESRAAIKVYSIDVAPLRSRAKAPRNRFI